MKEEVRREKEMNVEVLLYEYLAALKVINTEFTYTLISGWLELQAWERKYTLK